MESNPLPVTIALEPLAYQTALRDLLKRTDPVVWEWFADRQMSAKYADDAKFELLKSTYRIERDSQPALYEAADHVATQLGIAAPITLYQSQDPERLNASLAFIPGEVHLVFHGPIATQLSPLELRGLLGHELGHYLLWTNWQGEVLVASEMLQALVTDAQSHPAHFASWRLFRLYAEVFCDRAALAVTGDLMAIVSMLVKVQTGVQDVDPAAYLRQSEQVFSRGKASTEGLTHPEAFIRARAAQLWHAQQADSAQAIASMIEGEPGMDELDLLEQIKVAKGTRRLIDALLCHKWLQSDVALAHARLYFDDYTAPQDLLTDAGLNQALRTHPDSLRDYYAFVLLDFVTAERELEEAPLAAALIIAERAGIKARFVELARQELKIRKTHLDKTDQNKDKIVAEANRGAAVDP